MIVCNRLYDLSLGGSNECSCQRGRLIKAVAKLADAGDHTFCRVFGTICVVKRVRRKIVWLVAVAMGLCGGWLAAGALNDRRIDIPRRISPTSQPSSNAPSKSH